MLLQLEEQGILCCSGSARYAGRDKPSPVLLALGVGEEVARTAVRFSLAEPLPCGRVDQLVSTVGAAHRAVTRLGTFATAVPDKAT